MPTEPTKAKPKQKSKTKLTANKRNKQIDHDPSIKRELRPNPNGLPAGQVLLTEQKAKFPEVLKQTMGLVSLACEKVGISRGAYYDWRNSDPVFAALCDEVPDRVGDMVESKLYEKVQKGDGETIRFYCKTKLKHRGYTSGMEITGAGGGNLNLNLHNADAKKLAKLNNDQLQALIELQKIMNDESNNTGG